jgi:hypothetical protein
MQHIWNGIMPLTSIPAELRGSIRTFIPQIANLLRDGWPFVRVAATEALSKLSEQGM